MVPSTMLSTALVVRMLHLVGTSSAQLQSGNGITSGNDEIMQYTYYIYASSLEPCPEEMTPCLTLSQIVSNNNIDYHLSENNNIHNTNIPTR